MGVDFTSLRRPKTSNEINTISIRPHGKSLEPHSYFSHVLSGFFAEFFTLFFVRIDFRAFSQFSGHGLVEVVGENGRGKRGGREPTLCRKHQRLPRLFYVNFLIVNIA